MINDFESLNFPVFDSPIPEHKALSMDEFDQFNTEDMRDCSDPEVYKAVKNARAVNVMFVFLD